MNGATVMERISELLKNLQREETPVRKEKKQNNSSVLLKYKKEALKCEQRLQERKKQKHEQLLKRISKIEQNIQNKHSETTESITYQVPRNGERINKNSPNGQGIREKVITHDKDKINSIPYNKKEKDNGLTSDEALVESFSKLEDLQSQQKNLESWYHTMSEQLELEQRKLTEKFDDMKLKILQKKQYYLQTSQEHISNLSRESSNVNNSHKASESRPKTAPERYHRSKVQKNSNQHGSQSSLGRSILPYAMCSENYQGLEVHDKVSHVNNVDRSNTESRTQSALNGNHFDDGSHHVVSSDAENSYLGSRNITTQRHQANDSSLYESNELVDKTLLISPIHSCKNQQPYSQNIISSQKEAFRTDLLHRYMSSESPERRNLSSKSTQNANKFADVSHSTPLRNGDSAVAAQEDEMTQQGVMYATLSDTSLRASYDRLGAVAVGYLTRKLFRTPKVQTLIKTIKDTRSVLAGLEKDSSSLNKYSVVKAEQQLKANVQQELFTAQSKLYNVLLNLTSKEKIDIISKSRQAAVNRENQNFYKDKAEPSNLNKRLSTVTQKTIRRKLENHLTQQSFSRPHTSPAGKLSTDGKKQRKAWDIRSQKPLRSDGSPLYSERKKNRVVQSQQKIEEATTVNRNIDSATVDSIDLPLKRKIARKRQLAVTLNRKTSATNG